MALVARRGGGDNDDDLFFAFGTREFSDNTERNYDRDKGKK